MKLKLYLNGKRITQKKAIELVGDERFNRLLADAKDVFFKDPFVEISFFIGGDKILNFEFE